MACPVAPETVRPPVPYSLSWALNTSCGRSRNCPLALIWLPPSPVSVTVRSALNESACPVFFEDCRTASAALSLTEPVASPPDPSPAHPDSRSVAPTAVPPAATANRRFMRIEPPWLPYRYPQSDPAKAEEHPPRVRMTPSAVRPAAYPARRRRHSRR